MEERTSRRKEMRQLMADPFVTGLSGGSPETATDPVSPSTIATTRPKRAARPARHGKQPSSSGRANPSCSGPNAPTPCSSGGTSSTTAASWELTAPSSEMKARRPRHSLSAKLTLSLITSGLISGITPTSVRKQSGAAIPDLVSWPQAGSAAKAQRRVAS